MVKSIIKHESFRGLLLVAAAALAIIIANTPLNRFYEILIDMPVVFSAGNAEIAKPLLLWINDGLMAIFFMLVGLELKREFLEGELSEKRNIILPGIGAVGGMLVPALIYTYFNYNDVSAMKGWAIPSATDIAFALGVLSLLGNRVPLSLKILLVSIAIFDDIGAILIIALFYTSKISFTGLIVSGICAIILYIVNKRGIIEKSAYFAIGLIMWVAMLKSGVHATLAGIVLAMFIPNKSPHDPDDSPLKTLEHDLEPLVAYFILPIFAFTNSGINLQGVGAEQFLHHIPVGIALGLFFGKQLGIFTFCWIGVKLKLTELPEDISWKSLYGISALCGIGFTMSLFIGSLAFEETGINLLFDERVGIIAGSIASGLLGYFILNKSLVSEKSP